MMGASPDGDRATRPTDQAAARLGDTASVPSASDPEQEIARLRSENERLQGLLYGARAIAKARGRNLLREEANEALPYFTPAWEPLRDIAERAGVKSAAWLAGRARDLQDRNLVESRWVGAERTQFKLWRLKGRPVPVHASGGGQCHASAPPVQS